MAPNKRPILFISHITEEKEIGDALEALLRPAFLGWMDVFVSSIRLGSQWFETITTELKRCSVGIVIVGPASIGRPWINFETGAIWARDKPIIPLCHSGLTPAKLEFPLKSLQACLATDENSLVQVIGVIADSLGFEIPPKVDYAPFVAAVKSYETKTKQNEKVMREQGLANVAGLGEHEITVMRVVGNWVDSPRAAMPLSEVFKGGFDADYTRIAIMLGVDMLVRRQMVELVDNGGYNGEDWMIKLADAGLDWLHENSGMFPAKRTPSDRTPRSNRSPIDDDGPPKNARARPPVDDGDIPF